jgi:hypothetical protein
VSSESTTFNVDFHATVDGDDRQAISGVAARQPPYEWMRLHDSY